MSASAQSKHPLLMLEWSSELPIRVRVCDLPSFAKLSTIHSYHTFLPSVCRHMLTSSSASSATYNGVCMSRKTSSSQSRRSPRFAP